MSSPLRQNVKYIAELFQSNQWSPTVAIAPNNFSRQNNIFSFSIAPLITDPSNYWITWGGYFDNVVGTGVQVYMDKFLIEVFLESNLEVIENSFYIDIANNICYMNTDKNPWQYYTVYASVYGNPLSTFSTAPRNEDNLSDIYYGGVRAIPRMEIPSLNNAISDAISGVNVYNSFNINIDNRDGFFDGVDILNYFNTPLQISKTSTNAQSIDEFNQIRFGIVQDIKVDFKKIQITAVDQFYLMNKEYCRKFTTDEFPNISDSNLNENIPVGWGTLYGIEPIEVDKDTADPATWIDYIALDKSHITSVQGVFDKDGNSLTHSFSATTGIIRVTSVDGDGEVIEAEYMNVTGKTDCSIGEIIIEALAQNENIQYIEGIWDLTETDDYLSYCADIGFYFDGGTTKELIEGVLKNDIAFLIQKNNKLLTIRQWGKVYDTHYFDSWLATQAPKKNFLDATKYYCSSAKINYCKNWNKDDYDCNHLNNASELKLFGRWRKSYLAEFETDLVTEADAIDLSNRIIERFGDVRETIEVGLGADTFEINLLDTVIFEPTINGREFSPWLQWIVKECDPGQDVIKMEGLEKDQINQEELIQMTKSGYYSSDFPKVRSSSYRTIIRSPKFLNVMIDDALYVRKSATNLDLTASASWDTLGSIDYTVAANRAGKDFYIYATKPSSGKIPGLIISANSTYPSGYTATNSRKIGGFHCLCTSIGSAVYSYYNEGKDAEYINTIFADGSSITTGSTKHWLYGWTQGDILPFSCWDLLHRPNLNADVEGRVYNPKTQKWIMIYLPSWSAGLAKSISVYGGAISSGGTSPAFHFYRWEQVLANQGESLLSEKDFVSASLGSPQGVNISGSDNPVTTGGHISTDSKRIVSNIGCEDMTGVFWQWGNERGFNTTSEWANAYDANDKNVAGQHYSATAAAAFGGNWWYNGAYCGSRGSGWYASPLSLYVDYSGRGAAEPL